MATAACCLEYLFSGLVSFGRSRAFPPENEMPPEKPQAHYCKEAKDIDDQGAFCSCVRPKMSPMGMRIRSPKVSTTLILIGKSQAPA